MKLFLKNIGKIAEATVEIKGISVIAGENNTGKSTVGKALFSVFNSFYKIQEQILQERINSIVNILQLIHLNIYFSVFEQRNIARDILNKADEYKKEPVKLINDRSVKRANHNKGSMIVSDPTELVQPGGNNHSSRFVRLCVAACFIHAAG